MASGLPPETHRDDIDWNETMGYLDAISNSGQVVLISTEDKRQNGDLFQTRGYLLSRFWNEKPSGPRYDIAWPTRRHRNGSLIVPQKQFESSGLSTADGTDYFGLTISLGQWSILISDDNLVDWPQPEPGSMRRRSRERTLEELPTAEDVKDDFVATKDNPVTQELVREGDRLRDLLVHCGAAAAEQMSIFEIHAAIPRTISKLRAESVIPLDGDLADYQAVWIARLAEELTKRAETPQAE